MVQCQVQETEEGGLTWVGMQVVAQFMLVVGVGANLGGSMFTSFDFPRAEEIHQNAHMDIGHGIDVKLTSCSQMILYL